MSRILRKLRGRSIAEVRERGAQWLAARGERLGLRPTGEPDARLLARRLAPSRELAEVRRALRAGPRPALVPGVDALDETVRTIRARWPHEADALIRRADAIVAGEFQLLGLAPLRLPDPIEWQADPLTGRRAPAGHWSTIPYLEVAVVGDHKRTWELNRHQFLVTLGQAFALTGAPGYADRAAALLAHWMDTNPPQQGINWSSSLEVAYRAIAWTWTYRLLRGAPAFGEDLGCRLLGFLDASARHLERYLSTYFSPNTHLTGEALGLLYIGTQFPELGGAARWAARGWAILQAQLARHVRPDGTYFEQATCYHRYTLDIYLHARLLGSAQGAEGGARIDDALARLADVLQWMARGDGTVPLFGDEDGGRLLFLDAHACDVVAAPVATVAALLGRPRPAGIADPGAELAWLMGARGVAAWDALPAGGAPGIARAFPDGGLYVVRDGWSGGDASCVIDCGPLGADNGGHAHADTLALDLAVDGQGVLVDAGTVTYTEDPVLRNALRHSAAHNTLTLDGRSSSEPASPFQWHSMHAGRVRAWVPTEVATYFEGYHDGYRTLPAPARHGRQVLAVRGGWWLVRDVVESAGAHVAVVTFQCAAGVEAAVEGECVPLSRGGRPVGSILAVGGGRHGAWTLEAGIASRRYGACPAAPRLRFTFGTRGGTSQSFLIGRAGEVARVEHASDGPGEAMRLTWPGHVDRVLLGPARAFGVAADARAVLVREGRDGSASLLVIEGSSIEVDDVVLSAPGGEAAFSAMRTATGWLAARAIAAAMALPAGVRRPS